MKGKSGDIFAPIVIFTYRRSIHRLIASLQKNKIATKSDLFIFSDGYKNDFDKQDVLEVRKSLKNISSFNKVIIQESSTNKGLANSIIEGVTKVVAEYGKIIVLEDDLIVSNSFLDYTNRALEYYEKNKLIWSISGYTPALDCLNNYNKDIYLSLRASSWGWATWKDRWDTIDWEIKDWDIFKTNKEAIKKFNLGGNDMFPMLEVQMLGKIDSWAIRWCYNQYKYKKYTIYPTKSLLSNGGFDSKGTHNNNGAKRWKTIISNSKINLESIKIDNKIIKCFKRKYNLKFATRIGYFLKKHGGYKLAKRIWRKN